MATVTLVDDSGLYNTIWKLVRNGLDYCYLCLHSSKDRRMVRSLAYMEWVKALDNNNSLYLSKPIIKQAPLCHYCHRRVLSALKVIKLTHLGADCVKTINQLKCQKIQTGQQHELVLRDTKLTKWCARFKEIRNLNDFKYTETLLVTNNNVESFPNSMSETNINRPPATAPIHKNIRQENTPLVHTTDKTSFRSNKAHALNVGQLPNVGRATNVGQVPNLGNAANVGLVPNVDRATNVGQVPNMGHASNVGQVSNMGHATNVNQVPNMGHATNVGQVPNVGRATNVGQVPNLGNATNVGQVPNMGHATNVGQVPNMGHATNVGQVPNMGHATNVGQVPNMGHATNVSQVPNMGHASNVGQVPNMCHATNVGQVPNMGHATNVGQVPNIALEDNFLEQELENAVTEFLDCGTPSVEEIDVKDEILISDDEMDCPLKRPKIVEDEIITGDLDPIIPTVNNNNNNNKAVEYQVKIRPVNIAVLQQDHSVPYLQNTANKYTKNISQNTALTKKNVRPLQRNQKSINTVVSNWLNTVNTANTAMVNTTNTAMVNTTNTAMVNTTNTAMVNTTNTAMVNTANTALLNTPNMAMVNTAVNNNDLKNSTTAKGDDVLSVQDTSNQFTLDPSQHMVALKMDDKYVLYKIVLSQDGHYYVPELKARLENGTLMYLSLEEFENLGNITGQGNVTTKVPQSNLIPNQNKDLNKCNTNIPSSMGTRYLKISESTKKTIENTTQKNKKITTEGKRKSLVTRLDFESRSNSPDDVFVVNDKDIEAKEPEQYKNSYNKSREAVYIEPKENTQGIDWEVKIPMEVITYVGATDSTLKRPAPALGSISQVFTQKAATDSSFEPPALGSISEVFSQKTDVNNDDDDCTVTGEYRTFNHSVVRTPSH